jgi:hypothetical protein
MKLKFLCARHRQQLEISTSKAVRCWQDGFDTAQFFYDQRLWSDAVCHAGCAFETAEILIANKTIDYDVACNWFYHSTVLLSALLKNLDYDSQAGEVLFMAIDRFESELSANSDGCERLLENLNLLYKSAKGLNSEHSNGGSAYRSSNALCH